MNLNVTNTSDWDNYGEDHISPDDALSHCVDSDHIVGETDEDPESLLIRRQEIDRLLEMLSAGKKDELLSELGPEAYASLQEYANLMADNNNAEEVVKH